MSHLRLGVCLILAVAGIVSPAKEVCFQPSFTKTNYTDSPPRYIVYMNFTKDGTFGILTTVNDVIRTPITQMTLIQRSSNSDPGITLYNATLKLCELRQFITKLPMFNAIAQSSLKTSNYTFSCPLQKGVYVINEFRVPKNNPLLRAIYNPKKMIVFCGGMYEELPNRSMRMLSSYEIVLKIVRKTCS